MYGVVHLNVLRHLRQSAEGSTQILGNAPGKMGCEKMDLRPGDRKARLETLADPYVDIRRRRTKESDLQFLQGRIPGDPHGEIREMDRLRKEGRPFLDIGRHMGREQAKVRTVPGKPRKTNTGR